MTDEISADSIIYEDTVSFEAEDYLADDLAHMVDTVVVDHSGKDAFSCVLPTGHSAKLSYDNFGLTTDAIAMYLRKDLGLVKGDVVGLMALNILSYPVIALGALKAGLKLTNINPLYTADEANHQLKDSNAKVLFVVDLFADKMEEATKGTNIERVISLSLLDLFPTIQKKLLGFVMKYIKRVVPKFTVPIDDTFDSALKKGLAHVMAGADVKAYRGDIDPHGTAILQYTGGTTGRSKGAELSHVNVVGNISQAAKRNADYVDNKSHVMMLVLPLYHVYALAVGCLSSLRAGSHVVLVPVPRPLANLKPVFDQFDITVMPGVNTLFIGLMQEKWFLDNPPRKMEMCFSGAAPLQPATADAWEELTGAPIYEGYGLTEGTCIITSMNFNDPPVRGSCGQLVPGTKGRIIGEEGQDMPIGEVGELWLSGPQVMRGYLNKPDVNAEAFEGEWLKTGDIAKFDENGYLYIVDRKKDMVIVSGFNVFPTDIEDVLTRHSDVVDAAVVGVPDSVTGEKIVAYVVKSNPTLSSDDLISYCRDHLTGYKVPKIIRFLDELPKSPVGKILRRELRDKASDEEV